MRVGIIGAGLAGSDCAWALAQSGIEVYLFEKKRVKKNEAQTLDLFAELVCTNSLKSLNPTSAHGLLKQEMIALGSLIIPCAQRAAIGAGDALAVDRIHFSTLITNALSSHPNIKVFDMEVTDPSAIKENYSLDTVVVATGPLTSQSLEQWVVQQVGEKSCYFYDAIAPIVDGDSLDYSKLYFRNRWQEENEEPDYLNAPLNKEQYENFIRELTSAQKTPAKDFESATFFESCLPIDVMAERGPDTARFSCMKPIGLYEGSPIGKPYAVVQLRKENLKGSAFNLVGFQTRLTHSEQVRVFRMIPGLENANFFHLGSMHRNTFLNSAELLDSKLSLKKMPWLYFAGQMTGVEGYTESAACGLYVARQLIWQNQHPQTKEAPNISCDTALGALIHYILEWEKPTPSNINFGLFPMIELTKDEKKSNAKKIRREKLIHRAQQSFDNYLLQLQGADVEPF